MIILYNLHAVLHLKMEKKMDDLIKEKEVLATEVWKLRKSLAEATSAITPVSTPSADSGYNEVHEMNGLDNYDPQNPHALRRKISEYCHDLCYLHILIV